MPEQLPDFPDLATPAARATEPPRFAHIVARAQRRRRRSVLTAAVVTAAAVAAIATGAALRLGDQSSAPQPSKPSPSGRQSPSPTADPGPDAAAIIATGSLLSYAAGDDGSTLTVWQKCAVDGEDDCRSAWQLQQTAGATHRGLAAGDGPWAYRAGDVFVIKPWYRKGFVVDSTGTVRPLRGGEPGTVKAGDVLVSGSKRLVVIDPHTSQTWPLPRPDGVESWTQGVVAADGTVWAASLAGDQVSIWWSSQARVGSPWQHHLMPFDHLNNALPGYIAVSGGRVAAVSGYDGATILPVADLAITTDGGASWVDLHQDDLPFDTVDAMAATSGGTLYVVTAGGEHLFRTTDSSWTRFVEVPNPQRFDRLQPAGDRVLAVGGTATQPALFALDDAGGSTAVSLSR